MTIDPDKFEAQGLPTMEQVRTVWDAHPKPSSRTIAELMTKRGWSISYKTVSRWKKANWVQEQPEDHLPASRKPNERVVNRALRAEIAKTAKPAPVVDSTTAPDGIENALTGTGMTDADLARIEAAKIELGPKTIADLREMLEKERIIANIILLREATRKANIMVLIPKETSSFVSSFTDDAKAAGPAPATIQPPNSNPALAPPIEGDFRVVNPTSAAIDRFLAKENA